MDDTKEVQSSIFTNIDDDHNYETKSVKLTDISIPQYDPAEFMKKSVDTVGIINDVILIESPTGQGKKYKIVDGRRRIASAKEANYETIQAKVFKRDVSPVLLAAMTLTGNYARDHNPVSELEALAILEKKKVPIEELRQICNITKNEATELKKLLELPKPLYNALKRNHITWKMAKKIVRLSREMQKKIGKVYAENGSVTHKEIDDLNRKEKTKIGKAFTRNMFDVPETPESKIEGILNSIRLAELKKADKAKLIEKIKELK